MGQAGLGQVDPSVHQAEASERCAFFSFFVGLLLHVSSAALEASPSSPFGLCRSLLSLCSTRTRSSSLIMSVAHLLAFASLHPLPFLTLPLRCPLYSSLPPAPPPSPTALPCTSSRQEQQQPGCALLLPPFFIPAFSPSPATNAARASPGRCSAHAQLPSCCPGCVRDSSRRRAGKKGRQRRTYRAENPVQIM